MARAVEETAPAYTPEPRRAGRHALRWVIGAVVLLVVVAAGWLVWTGARAHSDLTKARAALSALRVDLTHDRVAPARALTGQVQRWAAGAHSATSGPVWALAAHLPVAGNAIRSVRGITASVDQVARRALPDVVSAASGFGPGALHFSNGTVNLAPLEDAAAPLARAAAELTAARTAVTALPAHTVLGAADRARASLLGDLQVLGSDVRNAAVATRVAPPMLGADGVRTYFVGFETEAELRGTGGLVGAYAVVRADHGHLSVQTVGADTALPGGPALSLPLPAAYAAQWRDDGTTHLWTNTDMSPDFPQVARIWLDMWAQRAGTHFNGAVVMDPQVLADVLSVTGPVAVPGGELTAANAVPLTEQRAYAQFADQNTRKAYLVELVRAVFNRLLHGAAPNPTALVRALGKDVGQRRLLLASADPAQEAQLATTPVAGTLPSGHSNWLGVFANNGAGSKLDYYLTARYAWRVEGCVAGRQASQLTMTVHSSAPASGLPAYAQQHIQDGYTHPPDMDRVYLYVYAPAGSQVLSVTQDGRSADFYPGTEDGHPVFSFWLDLNPGATQTVTVSLRSPGVHGAPSANVGPMAHPATLVVSGEGCP